MNIEEQIRQEQEQEERTPDHVDRFRVLTEEQAAVSHKMMKGVKARLRETRGKTSLRLPDVVDEVVAFDVAREFAAWGWRVDLERHEGAFVLAVTHPHRLPPGAFRADAATSNTDLRPTDGALSAEGEHLPPQTDRSSGR